ncbi:MAG: hypothetical protein NTX24_00565 [Candidatus Pacearchaeota archaeon]|nr:hypothetical protein [Candidatus Pacearchaeota archaeon]
MALKLNDAREPYREFYGRNVEQMPKLVADKRVPLNVAGLMQRRLAVKSADADVQTAWMDNYFDTGDAIAYHPDGKVKLVLDSQHLRNLTPESTLNNSALVLPAGVYETLQGPEFTRAKLEKYVGNWLKSDQAKTNPIWQALARDQTLLDAYVDHIFTEYQRRFAPKTDLKDITAMGAFIVDKDNLPKDVTMRALCVSRLVSRSYVLGGYALDYGSGRLVGLAPEAQVAKNYTVPETRIVAPTLDQVLALSNAHVSRNGKPEFDKDVRTLYKQ